ncbi:hypothetical protein ACJ4V0_15905 [Phreatobacter sp. HK31-P]
MSFSVIEATPKRGATNNSLKGAVRVARHSRHTIALRIAPDVVAAAGFQPDGMVSVWIGAGRDDGMVSIRRPRGCEGDFRLKSGLDQRSSSILISGVEAPRSLSGSTTTAWHKVAAGQIDIDLLNAGQRSEITAAEAATTQQAA